MFEFEFRGFYNSCEVSSGLTRALVKCHGSCKYAAPESNQQRDKEIAPWQRLLQGAERGCETKDDKAHLQ